MSCNSHKIRFLRQQIPSFDCVPGCHDCCGPVTTSSEEMARLPRKTAAEQEAAMNARSVNHWNVSAGPRPEEIARAIDVKQRQREALAPAW